MLSNEEKNKVRESIRNLKSQISIDRKAVNELKAQKEAAFQEKESLKAQLKILIDKVRSLRGASDEKSISSLRQERDQYNAKVREIISKIKDLRKDVVASGGKKVSVGRIKSDIERLEESIEIEAFEYTQEQKVLDKIKKLKKVYEEHSRSAEVSSEIRELAKSLDALKEHANSAHQKFKDKFDSNKDSVKEYRSLSKDLQKLKKKQESSWELFIVKKNDFLKAFKDLKKKLTELRVLEGKLDEEYSELRKVEESKKKVELEERTKSVEEKLKKSGKITTDDLVLLRED